MKGELQLNRHPTTSVLPRPHRVQEVEVLPDAPLWESQLCVRMCEGMEGAGEGLGVGRPGSPGQHVDCGDTRQVGRIHTFQGLSGLCQAAEGGCWAGQGGREVPVARGVGEGPSRIPEERAKGTPQGPERETRR